MHRCSLTPFGVFILILVYTVANVFSIATPDMSPLPKANSHPQVEDHRFIALAALAGLIYSAIHHRRPTTFTDCFTSVFARMSAFATGTPLGEC